MVLLISLCLFFQSAGVPFKASNEFEVKIDLQIKPRYTEQHTNTVEMTYNNQEKKRGTGLASYLEVKINLLKLSDQEVKAKIISATGSVVYNKKVKPGASIKLDIGFVDDIKERVTNGL